MKNETKHILRVVDANFNRSKEGLRVIEDTFRFILQNDKLRKKARKLRHSLNFIAQQNLLKDAILNRNSKKDMGKSNDCLEAKRANTNNVLYANFQRVKESLRVLEEFFKLLALAEVSSIKKIRYEIYTLEKESFKIWPPLCNS